MSKRKYLSRRLYCFDMIESVGELIDQGYIEGNLELKKKFNLKMENQVLILQRQQLLM